MHRIPQQIKITDLSSSKTSNDIGILQAWGHKVCMNYETEK